MNEFDIINKYLKPLIKKDSCALDLSDDIYYDFRKKIAISVDTYVHGIHFLESSKPKYFIKKILRASLSDLYCKGIKPQKYFLSFSLNKKLINEKWLKQVKKILKSENKKFNINLAGGDTSYSKNFVVTIVTLGDCKHKPVFRHRSKLNDDIYVTGNIGDSYLGLRVLKNKNNFGKLNSFFKKKYYEPDLKVNLSPYLHKFATSSIDISDGIIQDLKQMCLKLKFGAFINVNSIPISQSCKLLINKKKILLKNIFSNGDDYQIMFTSSLKNRSLISNISKKTKTKITRVGFIKSDKNIFLQYNNKELKINSKKMGYIHTF